jgi:putative holliday junction resolvase
MPQRPTRYLGIDYGARRIGLATADDELRLATPLAVIPGADNPQTDAEQVAAQMTAQQATTAVVGLPLNMTGTDSDQTRRTRTFAAALAHHTGYPVKLHDERLTSFAADQLIPPTHRKPRDKARTGRDAIAAQLILQAFLDTLPPAKP